MSASQVLVSTVNASITSTVTSAFVTPDGPIITVRSTSMNARRVLARTETAMTWSMATFVNVRTDGQEPTATV
jgi:hypothetical protein